MGIYSSYYLDSNKTSKDEECIKFLDWIGTACWRKWSVRNKWCFDLAKLKELSLAFPEVTFRLIRSGEDSFTYYALDGVVIDSIYFGIPNATEFKKARKARQTKMLNDKKLEEEKQKKLQKEKIIYLTEAKAKIEKELSELK